MDHDQQVSQLREFDQEVSRQPSNAQSYATKSFLEILIDLSNHVMEQDDNGTDAYKDELKVLKNAIRAFTIIWPDIFKIVCQNEAESRLWELARTLIDRVKSTLANHSNTGVRINAIKCLQVLVLLLSRSNNKKELSLNSLRLNHRLLHAEELEKEGNAIFDQLVELLKSGRESIVTATINCLVGIGKKRPQFLKQVILVAKGWRETRSKDDSPVFSRNVDKSMKLALATLTRPESRTIHRDELITDRSDERKPKRSKPNHAQQTSSLPPPATATSREYVPIIPAANLPNLLLNYDIMQIPLPSIVELCMTVLQTVPLEVMEERVPLLPPQGITLAVTRPGFIRTTTPPYPPPPDQTQYITDSRFKREGEVEKEEKDTDFVNVKQEPGVLPSETDFDHDIEMEIDIPDIKKDPVVAVAPIIEEEKKPRVELLASAEERASQALKLKPYELAKQNALSEETKKELLKMSLQRVIYAESAFQRPVAQSNDPSRKAIAAAPATEMSATAPITTVAVAAANTNSAKHVWSLLVCKLVTRGILATHPAATEAAEELQQQTDLVTTNENDNDLSNELKNLLLDFIVENLSSRNDLAIEWLHEEYLSDKRQERSNPDHHVPRYLHWFHTLLKKVIPTLDARDRFLAKFLLDVPMVDATAVDLIKSNLYEVPERFVPCLSTLCTLVTNRPTVRADALQVLLDLCTNENEKMRRTSIAAVKRWDKNQAEIKQQVEEFAVKSLNLLVNEKETEVVVAVIEDENTGVTDEQQQLQVEEKGEEKESKDTEMIEGEGQQQQSKEDEEDTKMAESSSDNDAITKASTWTEKDVVRHAELYFVLCSKNPSLLRELFFVYANMSENTQEYIRLHMTNMIKSIGMKSADLIQLLTEFPPGGETLVIRILTILCESKPPTREIVSATRMVFNLANERGINLDSLQPILQGRKLVQSTDIASSAAAAASTATVNKNK